LGTAAARKIAQLAAWVKALVELDHGLAPGSLHSSGSLLTRLRADYENDIWERNHSHIYWNFHVDKANIASYDYSALLYLNDYSPGNGDGNNVHLEDDLEVDDLSLGANAAKPSGLESYWTGLSRDMEEMWSSSGKKSNSAERFKGGLFAFLDADKDRLVAPRCGRLLSFSSGLENPHRVEEVTLGSRLVLAFWFTCSAQHSYGAYIRESSNAQKS
jgi:hypothetical protein